jgi:hypothetical protein
VSKGEETKTSTTRKKQLIAASSPFAYAETRSRADQGEQQRPVQERALLAAVEGGRQQRSRQRAVGVLGDVGDGEVMAQQRHQQRDRGAADREPHGVVGPPGDPRQQPVLTQARVEGQDGAEDGER